MIRNDVENKADKVTSLVINNHSINYNLQLWIVSIKNALFLALIDLTQKFVFL